MKIDWLISIVFWFGLLQASFVWGRCCSLWFYPNWKWKNSFDAIICSRLTISRSFVLYIILYALSGLLYSHRFNLYALFHFSFVGLIKRLVYQDVTRSFRSYSFETNHHPWNARFLSQWFELHRCGYCGGVRDIEKFSFLFSNNFRYFVIVRGLN